MSLINVQLGDFLLDKKLGAGGMGEVYRAKQISLDRIVAVKVLPKSIAAQEGFDERFKREARAAANLIHPNVIQVYHIGIDPAIGTPYFAMEYVEGEDLQQRMKRRGHRLPFEESVEIIAGVAAALACAFEKGIIHRDIKPSNIMIDKNEIVKVMDFGLAKATQDGSSHNLTQSGLIMGTPNYISPEAGKGDPVDSRSDIYSLGVAFYEMITGKLPFTASTPAAIIYKHVYEPAPPPRTISDDIPPFLEEICLRMIAKEPKDRYPNPKALLADLNDFKRNSAHYLQGGQRRTPVIGSGSISGDQTMTSSGSFPGKPGTGSRSNEQTQSFQTNATAAETQALVAATPVPAPVSPGKNRLATVAVVVLLLGVAGAGVKFASSTSGTKPPPNGSGGTVAGGGGPSGTGAGDGGSSGTTTVTKPGKAIFPLSKLEKLPKSVKIYVKDGFDMKELARDDAEIDPGKYPLVFKRPGYEDIKVTFQVAATGVTPALESLKLEFTPMEEYRRKVELAVHLIEDKQFREALENLKEIVEKAPDYAEAQQAYQKANKGHQELQGDYQRARTLFEAHRWADAKALLGQLPPSFDPTGTVNSLVSTCERNTSQLKVFHELFERQMTDGHFTEGAETLGEMDKLLPSQDVELKKARDRLREASRLLEAARRDMGLSQFKLALESLEPLLKDCPNHKEATELAAKARGELASRLSAAQQVEAALGAGEKAFALGQFESALSEASRALVADPGSKAALDLRRRAQARVGENEIARRFGALDEAFRTLSWGSRDKRIFSVLELVDASAHGAIKSDLEMLSISPIEIKEAAHADFAIQMAGAPGAETATVECSWNLKLGFPECDGAVPPSRGRDTSMTVRQKVGLKRTGSTWFFTSFEEIGKANVQ